MHRTSLIIAILFAITAALIAVTGNLTGAAIFLIAAAAAGLSAWNLLNIRKRQRDHRKIIPANDR